MSDLPTEIAALVERLEALQAKATRGPWQHYDEVFRPKFGRRRVTEIQDRNGRSIVSWSGFDGNDHQRKNNHNARLMVESVNALPTILAALRAHLATKEPS